MEEDSLFPNFEVFTIEKGYSTLAILEIPKPHIV